MLASPLGFRVAVLENQKMQGTSCLESNSPFRYGGVYLILVLITRNLVGSLYFPLSGFFDFS